MEQGLEGGRKNTDIFKIKFRWAKRSKRKEILRFLVGLKMMLLRPTGTQGRNSSMDKGDPPSRSFPIPMLSMSLEGQNGTMLKAPNLEGLGIMILALRGQTGSSSVEVK